MDTSSNWETVSVFISSTFNDMHAERDYLVKYVFPELAERCEKRKIRLVDVDLRWGVTHEESENNDALRKCLENIDDTHRFFLCLIGQRRGWVPNENPGQLNRRRDELIGRGLRPDDTVPPGYSDISQTTTDEYPELLERDRNPARLDEGARTADRYKSVTEIEVEHALLGPMYRMVDGARREPDTKSHAVFFERVDTFTDQLSDAQKKIYTNAAAPDPRKADQATRALKHAVRTHIKSQDETRDILPYSCQWDAQADTPELARKTLDGLDVGHELRKGRLVNFTVGGRPLKDVVIDELEALIFAKYPDRKTEIVSDSDRYAKDREQQELFVQIASDGYIQRSDIENKLNEYIEKENNTPLLLTAEAGLGKTTLLAQYVRRGNGRSLFDDSTGMYRFCGTSDLTSDPYMLWDSLCHQAGMDTPDSYEKLKQNIGPLLHRIAKKGHRHLVIDAVNQLAGGDEMLDWFPETLPAGMRVVFSIKVTEENRHAVARMIGRFATLPVGKLADFAVKKTLIQQFLKRYLKAFDEDQMRDICGGIEWVNGTTRHVPFPDGHHTDNPLFLKILLHELHYFGSFSQLSGEASRYGTSPRDAFRYMLARLEQDGLAYESILWSGTVPLLFGLLAHARHGLSETELLHCFQQTFGISSDPERSGRMLDTIRFYLRQVRPFVARRDGRVDFLYEEFATAVREAYPVDRHLMLARALFGTRPSECAYHARQAADREYLKIIYADLDFLNRYCVQDGSTSLYAEMRRAESGIIPVEIQQFVRETVAMLAQHPEAAPASFYKELPPAYKPRARALCQIPWIKMDRAALPVERTTTLTVGSTAIRPLDIRSGHVATASGEAFFLVSANEVHVVNMGGLHTVTEFTVSAGTEMDRIIVSPGGDDLVAITRDGFSVFHLRRDVNGVVISFERKLDRTCRRIRFGNACVFPAGSRLIYQTPDNELRVLTLHGAFPDVPLSQIDDLPVRDIGPECPICGYYEVNDARYYVFKKSGDRYVMLARAGDAVTRYELTANVNGMLSFNGRLVILTDKKALLLADPPLHCVETLPCDFVPRSGAPFGDSLLLTSEHGYVNVLGPDGTMTDYGMLSVGRWDMKNQVHAVGDKNIFFFSDCRYARIEEIARTNITVIKAQLSNERGDVLFVDENKQLRFKTRGTDQVVSQDILQAMPYGLTSLMSYRCAWNRAGALVHQWDGWAVELIAPSGTRTKIDPPDIRSVVADILYSDTMNLFVVLYYDGKIKLIDDAGRSRDAETFQSSSRNYLLCDGGEFFCVLTRRRLVQAATLYEETALAIHDRKGRMVFEKHYDGMTDRPIENIAYDRAENLLYAMTTHEAIFYEMGGKFTSGTRPFHSFVFTETRDLAAHDGLLYCPWREQGLCVVDLRTGRPVAHLPTHRSVSSIRPCLSGIAVMENNEMLYNTLLERSDPQ